MMFQAAREHLQKRFTEWVIAFALIAWGVLLLSHPGYFDTNVLFATMASIAGPGAWGSAAIFIGGLRVVFLTINGTYRQSGHIRAVGSGLSAVMWATIWGSYLANCIITGYYVVNLATVGALLLIDIYSLWFAAEDAKRADNEAKQDHAIGKAFREGPPSDNS
jgi:hypothetical protein